MDEERRNDIVDELKELGRQLQALIRAAAESERSRELQQDLTKGIGEVTRQVDVAVKQARQSQTAQELGSQVRKVVELPQVAPVADEVRTGLLRGLQELNEQLRRVAERAETRGPAGAQTPPPPGDEPWTAPAAPEEDPGL